MGAQRLFPATALAGKMQGRLILANALDFPARRRSCEAVRAILDTDPAMEAYRVAQALAQQGARSDR